MSVRDGVKEKSDALENDHKKVALLESFPNFTSSPQKIIHARRVHRKKRGDQTP